MRVNQTMIAFLICKREVYAISIMREAFIWNLNLVVTGILFCKQYFEQYYYLKLSFRWWKREREPFSNRKDAKL